MSPFRILDCVLLLSIVPCCDVSMTDPAYAAADDSYRPMGIQTSGVPNVPAELIERLRQYQNVRSASFRGWAPDGRQLGFTLSRPDAPSDVYSYSLVNKTLARWTYSEVGGLDASRFVTPKRIKYRTFDGRMIPAYYFKPSNASKDEPVAVLINIHGGPESQYRPYFSGIDQFCWIGSPNNQNWMNHEWPYTVGRTAATWCWAR